MGVFCPGKRGDGPYGRRVINRRAARGVAGNAGPAVDSLAIYASEPAFTSNVHPRLAMTAKRTAAATLSVIVVGCASAQADSRIVSSFCGLTPETVETVRIVATYVTDHFHEPLLIDAACPNRRFVPMIPTNPDSTFGELAVKRFALVDGPGVSRFRIDVEGRVLPDASRDIPIFSIEKAFSVARLED